jgi:hypothetical protein
VKVEFYMFFEVTLSLTYDVIENMLYYHFGPYLGVYLQGQDQFDPSKIGSKLCSEVPVVTISLGRKWNQAPMCTSLLL